MQGCRDAVDNISVLSVNFLHSVPMTVWIHLELWANYVAATNLLIQSPLEMRWGSALGQGHRQKDQKGGDL